MATKKKAPVRKQPVKKPEAASHTESVKEPEAAAGEDQSPPKAEAGAVNEERMPFGEFGNYVQAPSNEEILQAQKGLALLEPDEARAAFDDSVQHMHDLSRCIDHYKAVLNRLDYAHSVIFKPLTGKTAREKFAENMAHLRAAQAQQREQRTKEIAALKDSGLNLRQLSRIGRGAQIDQVMKGGNRNPAMQRKVIPAKNPEIAKLQDE